MNTTSITLNQELPWIESNMPRTMRQLARLPSLAGVRLAMSMHLDKKMLPLVRGLRHKGAELFITTCNVDTVRQNVVDVMRSLGATVQAGAGMSRSDWQAAVEAGIAWEPTHLCEMGADFTSYLLQRGLRPAQIRAGLEATGSGINALLRTQIDWPVYNWDDVPVKEGLHNRHMVGLTTWHAFFLRTLLSLHEKRVLVVGYGTVGQGLAASARAFGGTVMVAELDAARLLQAAYDGWITGSVAELAPQADVIVTATGAHHALPYTVLQSLRDGCFVLSSGHRIDEIELEPLLALPRTPLIPYVDAYRLPSGNTVRLFAQGAMSNLAAGEGDSLNSFDVTLAVMTAGISYIATDGMQGTPGLQNLPQPVWARALSA